MDKSRLLDNKKVIKGFVFSLTFIYLDDRLTLFIYSNDLDKMTLGMYNVPLGNDLERRGFLAEPSHPPKAVHAKVLNPPLSTFISW